MYRNETSIVFLPWHSKWKVELKSFYNFFTFKKSPRPFFFDLFYQFGNRDCHWSTFALRTAFLFSVVYFSCITYTLFPSLFQANVHLILNAWRNSVFQHLCHKYNKGLKTPSIHPNYFFQVKFQFFSYFIFSIFCRICLFQQSFVKTFEGRL